MTAKQLSDVMKGEYDFSDSVPNPYFKKLKKQAMNRIEKNVVNCEVTNCSIPQFVTWCGCRLRLRLIRAF